jgi:branched-chain amino acid transport system substrate-binding protein
MRKEEPGVSAHLPWFSKNAVAVGAVALSVGVLAACSSSSSSTNAGTTPTGSTSSTGPITIGASLSFGGDFAADGAAFKAGYNLWAKDVNASGGILGRQVKLTYLDDHSQPNQAVTNYTTLISTDHVNLTFGPFSSLLTGPASAVAARYGYAFLEGAGGAPAVFNTPSNQADHNVFDVSLPVANALMPFVQYITALSPSQRPKTAAFPMTQDAFTIDQVQLAESKLRALGVTVKYDKIFPQESTAYKTAADAVAALKPDVVVLGSVDVPTVKQFAQAFQQQHYTPKMFLATAGPDQGTAFTTAVGAGNANGFMVPNGWYPGNSNPASQKMVSEYVAQYGGNASGVNADVAEAYAVGQVMEQAITATKSVDNAKIIAYLHSGVTLNTVQGPVKFDGLGENGAALSYMFQWQQKGTQFVQVLPTGSGSKPLIDKSAWTS